jgi:tyrosine-protein phosphatase
VSSTPNFRRSQQSDSTYYPPHLPSGRPGMHYLKLEWSHGQQDLVNNGFQAAMSFVDDALSRSEGVLVQ